MKKGVFWCVDAKSEHPKLITVSVSCDADGNPDAPAAFTSKAGANFNHKAEWDKLDRLIRGGVPYNYYPRGRVEIRNGRATVYLNPDINREEILRIVFEAFELKKADGIREIVVKSDGSRHYRYLSGEAESGKIPVRLTKGKKHGNYKQL